MIRLQPRAGWWPAVYPLRGMLGETRYTRMRPGGESATESALFMPYYGCFRLLGMQLTEMGQVADTVLDQLPAEVIGVEVLLDDVLPVSRSYSILVGLDHGDLVARRGTGAGAHLLRGQFAPPAAGTAVPVSPSWAPPWAMLSER